MTTKAVKVDPNSAEGLGGTYYSQADSFGNIHNKWNWKCPICNKVYLNRWYAQQCCSDKKGEGLK